MKSILFFGVLLSASLGFASVNTQGTIEVSVSDSPVTAGYDYHRYNFGRVMVHTSQTVYFTVRNTGNTVLNFRSAYMSGGLDFNAYHSCLGQLQPGFSCSFQIRYWPANEGYHWGRFELNYMENTGVLVNVQGQAVRR